MGYAGLLHGVDLWEKKKKSRSTFNVFTKLKVYG